MDFQTYTLPYVGIAVKDLSILSVRRANKTMADVFLGLNELQKELDAQLFGKNSKYYGGRDNKLLKFWDVLDDDNPQKFPNDKLFLGAVWMFLDLFEQKYDLILPHDQNRLRDVAYMKYIATLGFFVRNPKFESYFSSSGNGVKDKSIIMNSHEMNVLVVAIVEYLYSADKRVLPLIKQAYERTVSELYVSEFCLIGHDDDVTDPQYRRLARLIYEAGKGIGAVTPSQNPDRSIENELLGVGFSKFDDFGLKNDFISLMLVHLVIIMQGITYTGDCFACLEDKFLSD